MTDTVSEGSLGALRWKYLTRTIAPELRPHVDLLVGYEEWAPSHRVLRHEVPRTGATIILQLGSVLGLGSELAATPRVFVVGGMGKALTRTCFDRSQRGVEIALSPLGARSVLGVYGSEMVGRVLPLADLVPGMHGLIEALERSTTWVERLERAERWLKQRIAASRDDARLVGWIVAALEASGGLLSIRDIVRRSGYSHGHVGRLCRRWVGGTPKALGRTTRFMRLVEALRRGPWHGARGSQANAPVGWSRLAAELGYSDHSHLVREVRAFTGVSPSALPRLLNAELRPLEAGSNSSKPRCGRRSTLTE